jgi:PAS domain S-box-containing protein
MKGSESIPFDQLFLELTFAVTGETEEQAILEKTLPMYLRKLNCIMVAVIKSAKLADEAHVVPHIYIEDLHWSEITLKLKSFGQKHGDLIHLQLDTTHYYAYPMEGYGWLVLGRTDAFSLYLCNELKNVVIHLGKALNLALEIKRRIESEEKMRQVISRLSLLESLIEGVRDTVQVSNEFGQIVYLNKEASQRTGIPVDDCSNYNVLDFETMFKDQSAWQEHISDLRTAGRMVIESVNINRTNGLKIPVEVTVSGAEINGEFHVIAISRDISKRLENEARLRNVSDTLSSVVNALPDMILRLNRDLIFTYCHTQNTDDLLFPPESIIGASARALLPEHLVLRLESGIEQVIAGEPMVILEYSVAIASKTVWFEARLVRVNDDEFLCIIRNINDRVLSQAAVDSKERMLMAVSQSTTALLSEQDLFSAVNKSLSWLGQAAQVDRTYLFTAFYRNHELRLRQRLEWCNEGIESQLDVPELQDSASDPLFDAKIHDGEPFDYIVRNLPDESELKAVLQMQGILSILIIPIVVNEKFWGFVGFDDCKSERIWTPAELSLLRSFSSSIASSLERADNAQKLSEMARFPEENPSPIIRIDNMGDIKMRNPAASGITEFVFRGKRMSDREFFALVALEMRGSTKPLITEVTSGKVVLLLEARRSEADGDINLFSTDVTRLKMVEDELMHAKIEAEKASAAKSQFLANMSHEIRTPLNSIIGFSELLTTTNLEPQQQRYLNSIDTSGRVLLDTINDILDLSKIEAGKLEIENSAFEITELENNLRVVFNQRAKQKGIQLLFNRDANVPQLMKGDVLRIRQILINLVGNAVKFTNSGHVELSISQMEVTDDQHRIRFMVQDTGIGISKEKQAAILEAFSQEDISVTRRFGGTGLGLAISKKLVELMGGELQIESTPGIGSTFYFSVLLTRAKASEVELLKGRSKPSEALKSALSDQQFEILLVDDSVMNLVLARSIVQNMLPKVKIFEVESGEKAIEYLKKNTVDLIFMDVQMPEMSGYEATQHIRNQLNLLDVPIVALTAGIILGERERCLAAGMNDYLSKPISTEELREVMRKYLKIDTRAIPAET